jgi:ParB family chromosome partitioning protein
MSKTAYIKYGKIVYIKTEKLLPRDRRIKREVGKDSVLELARSVEMYGVLEPITVRSIGHGYYEIISGERRYRAAKAVGMISIPSAVINIGSREAEIISAISGYAHSFHFIEEAETYQSLMAEYGYSAEDIAYKMGKSIKYVNNKLSVLRLSSVMRDEAVYYGIDELTAIYVSQIRDEELRKEVWEKIIKLNPSGETAKRIINTVSEKKNKEKSKAVQKITGHINDIRIFTNSIKNAVKMMNEAGIETAYKVSDNDDGYSVMINVNWKKSE